MNEEIIKYSKQQTNNLKLNFSDMAYLQDGQNPETEVGVKHVTENMKTPQSDISGNYCCTNNNTDS